MIAATPKPPYFAVIFTSHRTEVDDNYEEVSAHMADLASQQPGFLGIESIRNDLGVTISYWESLEAITAWRANAEHRVAQTKGRDQWYCCFRIRVCKVEREYGSTHADCPHRAAE